MRVRYLDSSAIVKLVVEESESRALRRHLRDDGIRATSEIARVEVVRAVRRHGVEAIDRARRLLREADLVGVNDTILENAAAMEPPSLRSLNAVHLATAMQMATDLEALISYDRRMVEAARALGLAVASPA